MASAGNGADYQPKPAWEAGRWYLHAPEGTAGPSLPLPLPLTRTRAFQRSPRN